MSSQEPILRTEGIVKKFPGVVALKGIDFDLYQGEIHAIVGQNGAGKSTFVKILNGIYVADQGRIFIRGKEVSIKKPIDAKRNGITLVHQEITLIPYLSIAENIFLARIPFIKRLMLDKKEIEAFARKYLKLVKLNIDPWIKVKELSVGEQELVQIARALAENADIICLDEPTSALTPAEVDNLFSILKDLAKSGKAIIFITHHIDEVFRIADRVTVLRDGRKIATLKVSETNPYEVVKLMLGREPSKFYVVKEKMIGGRGKPVLVVKNLSTVPEKVRGVSLKNISFDLYKGEILGVVGLLGAGKTELGKALIGLEKVVSGEVFVDGKKVTIKSPIDALKYGIYYLPENRRIEGLVLSLTIRENIVLSIIDHIVKYMGLRDIDTEKKIASEWIRKLNIVAPSTETKVMSLSGGNQQKVVIAKALVTKPRIVIFDEPTMGIDVGAKVEIRRIISELAKQGLSIILLSSDVDEVLALADRVLVLYKGSQVALIPNKDLSRETVLDLMSGGSVGEETVSSKQK